MIDIGFKYKVYNPYIVAAIAVMGGMLFGFDISSMSSLLSNENYVQYFGVAGEDGRKTISAIRQAGITSSMSGGSFLGSLIAGPTSDKLGRKPVLQLSSWVWIIGAAIQTSSQNVTQLILGRIIAGFAVGMASSQVPVFIAEMAPKKFRGMLVGAFQWFVTWGILIMFYIGFGCGQIKSDAAFRVTWGIQMVPGLVFFIGTLFINESPRWLAAKGHWEKAIDIIAKINAKGDFNDPVVKVEVEEIKEAVRIEKNSNFRFWHLFKGKTNLRRTFIGVTCQMWQQLTGINVDMYYVTTVFKFAGYEGNANLVASSIQYIINTVTTIPALIFVDRWGRRPLLFFGAVLMAAWMAAMAGVLAVNAIPKPNGLNGDPQIRLEIPPDRKSASKGLIAISYLFVASYAPTWGPGGWIYCSEIFPLEQRALGNALCASVNWAFNLAIGMFTPSAFVNITWKTYIVFAVFCFAMAIHVFLMYPETHGLCLEEVEELFQSEIPAWRSNSFKPSRPQVEDIDAVGGGYAPSLKEKATVEHIDSTSAEEYSLSP